MKAKGYSKFNVQVGDKIYSGEVEATLSRYSFGADADGNRSEIVTEIEEFEFETLSVENANGEVRDIEKKDIPEKDMEELVEWLKDLDYDVDWENDDFE